ncbi:MAG: hypothetical protein O3C34_09315 [Proteobacteria bacterium]|nr:hypothetical protein [Pseudomonadota bacterium]
MARDTAKLARKDGAAGALAGALLVWLMTGCAQTTLYEISTTKDVLAEGIEALDDRYTPLTSEPENPLEI